ncbi:MAG: hypothetical protein ACUVTU_10910 [Desulfurispora sp.]|uniref:hypothetical protein n=1 Tax=Desulfurispora sp. TaxID=3014275 RepID=UPI00404A5C3D
MLLLAVILLLAATLLAVTSLIWLAVSAARQPDQLSGLDWLWLKEQTGPGKMLGLSLALSLLALTLAWFR